MARKTDSTWIFANLDKLRIECKPIPDHADAIVIEVPPFPRLGP